MRRPGLSRARSRRVLIVTENIALGRDHRAKKQVQSLLAAGWKVSFICRRDPDNEPFRNMAGLDLYEYRPPTESSRRMSYLYEYAYSLLAAAWLTITAALKGGFDVIQVGDPPDIHFLLALPFKLLGRSFVIDQRDLSPELYTTRYGQDTGLLMLLLRALERASWRTADHVLCISRGHRRVILERGGVPETSITIVGNGPLLAKTRPRAAQPELKRGRSFLVCWVGVMGAQDRVDLALHAVRHLVYQLGRTDCHFAFIGDGEVLPEMRQLARQLEITDWVTFTGWLEQDACFAHLSTADLGLEPTMQDIATVKCLEYMAFGVPIVAFDLEEIRAPADGAAVYVPPGDVPAFALAISRLLDDPTRRAEMGRLARRQVEETHAWDRQEEAFLRVYKQLLSS
ncbi:MAG TPA: glycosyltransferase family 4 protein [Actinomycetes bacterium]|jgi:glycosyltransferase involved in cell wall biosynthesis